MAKKKTKKKTARKKTAAKKKTRSKKKTATKKKTAARKKTSRKTSTKKTAKKKTASKKKTSKKKTASKKKTSKKKTAAKKKTKKKGSRRARRDPNVVPWSQRFKQDTTGPWTCPKCGPLTARANPLYGEDERHHCPNLDCDAVVTLLSKEDLEPTERRGSWPPQRNKNRQRDDAS